MEQNPRFDCPRIYVGMKLVVLKISTLCRHFNVLFNQVNKQAILFSSVMQFEQKYEVSL